MCRLCCWERWEDHQDGVGKGDLFAVFLKFTLCLFHHAIIVDVRCYIARKLTYTVFICIRNINLLTRKDVVRCSDVLKNSVWLNTDQCT